VPRIAAPGAIDRFVEDHLGLWSRLADLASSAAGRVDRLKAEEVLELGRLYRAATGDDLRRVARQYLVADNRVTSLFVPENA